VADLPFTPLYRGVCLPSWSSASAPRWDCSSSAWLCSPLRAHPGRRSVGGAMCPRDHARAGLARHRLLQLRRMHDRANYAIVPDAHPVPVC